MVAGSPINPSEYKYVSSGRSARGGVMRRVAEHTNPEYRNSHRSELYRVLDGLRPACVAIYLLAEWDPLLIDANPGHAGTFDDILLAEAISGKWCCKLLRRATCQSSHDFSADKFLVMLT